MDLITYTAADHGTDAGRAVLAGTMTVEAAGDLWVTYADASHEAGDAFLAAFDATGAAR